ncbi:MAG: choice-of-anchor X domain-containing protein [Anaerolineae bacterium]
MRLIDLFSGKNLVRIAACVGLFAVVQAALAAEPASIVNEEAVYQEVMSEAQRAPLACPANPAGLPDTIERPNFCVFYDDGDTTDVQATFVADQTQIYWDRYVALGFQAPFVAGSKLEVHINDAACNGSAWDDNIKVNNGCFSVNLSMNNVVGHEVFHRVQMAYDTDWQTNATDHLWFFEGTARAMEDKTFANIDNWAESMAAAFSFNQELNDYLANTNTDITSDPMRYESAMFWTYFMEQYGTDPDQPELGVDAVETLWDQTATKSDLAAVNAALSSLGTGETFDSSFRKFTAANWLKDLNGASAEYNYIDEDEAGNPAPYGPIVPTTGGTISDALSANWNNQAISRYGAQYYRAAVDNDCKLISASLNTDSGPAFYHVISEKNGTLGFFDTSTATSWNRSFFNDGISHITVVAGSTGNSSVVDVSLTCLDPVIEVKLPNTGAVASVGPAAGPGKFIAQVLVTNGTSNGPVIDGLTVSDFKAAVGGQESFVTAGGFIQEQYWLVVQAPVQAADGLYDLEIRLEESGTATTIATDNNANSISYTPDNVDHLLVIDRSGSMNSDGKFIAAQNAANFYIDITRNNDGLAVVPYHTDVDPAPFALQAVTTVPNVRANAENYVDALFTGNLTSIGDGLAEAVNQRNGNPTGNPLCSFVLLTDGIETADTRWADVSADVIATGCPVTTIAFGQSSAELLLQDIATQTGGLFFYNDVFVSARAPGATTLADMNLELGNSYEYAQAESEGRVRLLQERGVVPILTSEFQLPPDQIHKVYIDETVSEAVFSLDWHSINEPDCDNTAVSNGCFGKDLAFTLIKPDGKAIDPAQLDYSFEDIVSGHVGWRVTNPMVGEWTMVVNADSFYVWYDIPYQVIVSGPSSLTAELLLADRTGAAFMTGNKVPIHAFVSSDKPVGGAGVMAEVTAPHGIKTLVPLYDDGQHGDGQPNDGFYSGEYTHVNQATREFPNGEDGASKADTPVDEGSYRVRLLVELGDIQREALGSFSVEEAPDENFNGIPDPYEKENGTDSSDADLDGLDLASEYQLGTDPNNSDTDGGGENDGSEFFKGQDPFNPDDDNIVAPEYLKVVPNIEYNEVRYDVAQEYDRLILYRATSPNGPWELRNSELPDSGQYEDEATNGQTYYYRYFGIDAEEHGSAVIASEAVTPAEDPFAPEADMLINDGAVQTTDLNVKLTFVEAGHSHDSGLAAVDLFDDITEMKISNQADLSDADWVSFTTEVDWRLEPDGSSDLAKVYAQFRDGAKNESVITTAVIMIPSNSTAGGMKVFLPMIGR